MRVAEFSERRLRLRTGVPFFTSKTLQFDKGTGVGTLRRHGIFTNRRSEKFQLDDVTDVSMLKLGTNRNSTYHASISLAANRSIRLLGRRQSEIKVAVTAMRAFLGVRKWW
jgi:hypothetical protein